MYKISLLYTVGQNNKKAITEIAFNPCSNIRLRSLKTVVLLQIDKICVYDNHIMIVRPQYSDKCTEQNIAVNIMFVVIIGF